MATSNHFEVLGLTPKYHIDLADLEARYLALSRELHPDRHAKATPHERLLSVQKTTDLNLAYRVLKDPRKRATYILKLGGIDIAEERPAGAQTTTGKIDNAFLMEIMELREALLDAQLEKDVAKVGVLKQEILSRRDGTLRIVDEGFTKYEAGDKEPLAEVARAMLTLRYFDRFLDEVATFEEKMERP